MIIKNISLLKEDTKTVDYRAKFVYSMNKQGLHIKELVNGGSRKSCSDN